MIAHPEQCSFNIVAFSALIAVFILALCFYFGQLVLGLLYLLHLPLSAYHVIFWIALVSAIIQLVSMSGGPADFTNTSIGVVSSVGIAWAARASYIGFERKMKK